MSNRHSFSMSTDGLPGCVVNACAAMTYVTKPEIWPEFVAWVTTEHPEGIPANFDSDHMRHATMYSVADLVNHFGGH
jgi:hypothetical protein